MDNTLEFGAPDAAQNIAQYDALLLLSFGGPEGMDDVIPFLENVLRGRNVPRSRLEHVAEHYYHFGGVSPINGQNRDLLDAIRADFAANGLDLPVYWGNRNWDPYLADTLREMRDDGVKKALAIFTTAYSSYSSCRQYRENIVVAQTEVEDAPEIHKLRAFYNHPGFIEPNIEHLQEAFAQIPEERRSRAALVFTAHSLPMSMARNCAYEVQMREASRLVAEGIGRSADQWSLVYQSRSGSPQQPWLEPDISDHLNELHQQGVTDVVVMPVGFISDHMEVMYDLDHEAQEHAEGLGMNMIRAATVGTHPRFVQMIRELVLERMTGSSERAALGRWGASHDVCPVNCCLAG